LLLLPSVQILCCPVEEEISLVEAYVRAELALYEAMGTSQGPGSSRSSSRAAMDADLDSDYDTNSRCGSSTVGSGATKAELSRSSRSAPDLAAEEVLAAAAAGGGVGGEGGSDIMISAKQMERLQADLVRSFFAMPVDLKQALIASPQRLALLMGLVQEERHHDEIQELVQGMA
jgi:hypothetical protein